MYHSLRVSSSGNNLQVYLRMCTMFSIQDRFRLIMINFVMTQRWPRKPCRNMQKVR